MPTDEKRPAQHGLNSLLFRHNLWANLRLIEACLPLSAEQLAHSDPGSFGSIQATLEHLVRAEERYLYFLSDRALPDAAAADPNISLAGLRDQAQRSGERLIQLAADGNSAAMVWVGPGEEKREQIPAAMLLLQAIHHAHEHRTQVATLMGQLGLTPPPTSGWTFHDEGEGQAGV